MNIIKLREFFSFFLEKRRFFKIPEFFISNIDWFNFFEKNNFSEKFIMDELNFSNINLLIDKFSIQLRIKIESDFYYYNYNNNFNYFIIQEIQNKYMFYSLTRRSYVRYLAIENELMKKNKCIFL